MALCIATTKLPQNTTLFQGFDTGSNSAKVKTLTDAQNGVKGALLIVGLVDAFDQCPVQFEARHWTLLNGDGACRVDPEPVKIKSAT